MISLSIIMNWFLISSGVKIRFQDKKILHKKSQIIDRKTGEKNDF